MKFRKYFKRIFIILLSLFLLLITTGLVITYFYDEEVKQFVVKTLNKQLNTKIKVEKIELSLFRKFPYAAVEFTNVSAQSVSTQDSSKKNLFDAHKVYLQFNIWDIFSKNYQIKKIDIDKATFNLFVDEKGNDNYHFWKESASNESKNFSFGLKNLVLHNSEVFYTNNYTKQNIQLKANKVQLSGEFSNNNYSLRVKADLYFHSIEIDKVNYLNQQVVDMNFVLEVEKNKNYTIKEGEIQLAKLFFDVNGNINVKEQENILDLHVKGKNIDITSLLRLLPEKYAQSLKAYHGRGIIHFTSNIQGAISSTTLPHIEANFGIIKGELTEINSGIKLENIKLRGTYTNGIRKNPSTNSLYVPEFSARLGEGNIKGIFRIDNFETPQLYFNTQALLNLGELQKFIALDTIENLTGQLNVNISYKGKLKEIRKYKAADFQGSALNGSLSAENIGFKLKNSNKELRGANLILSFDNDNVIIHQFSGKIKESDFELKGAAQNILPFLFIPSEHLIIEASLYSKQLNVDELISFNENTASTDTTFMFPEKIDFNFNSEIKNFRFRKFAASDLRGNIKLKNKRLAFDPLSFNTMEGSVTASGLIDGSSAHFFKVISEVSLKKINIQQLFYQLNNFGQSVMQYKQVKGILTANIQFSSTWTNKLEPKQEDIYAKADIAIEKGELINFEPLLSLSNYIAVSELKHIKFSTLKNIIEIKNQKIYFPKTEIKSSALNLTASGIHSFNNEIEYHFKLSLSDLLSNKAKQAKHENEEFGIEQDDGLGGINLFLSMTGTVDNPIISYDKSGAKQQFRENMQTEKQNLKSILQKEFGWFKKDTTINKSSKKENYNYQIEWEENKNPGGEKELSTPLPKVKSSEKETKNINEPANKNSKKNKEENSDDYN